MRKGVILIFLVLFGLLVPQVVHATYLPFTPEKNNKFGIHILDESDLIDASKLVNSNGGEWGYVTIVIRQDERNLERWSNAFSLMSTLKIIPIVRLATVSENGIWKRPSEDDAKSWADFLRVLPWPTTRHYVVLFNEPNHAKEWGGQIDPADYARISRRYWEELKKADPNFFVLPAGFDAAAPNGKTTMDTKDYFANMFASDELIFTIFDGWTSHSYPNPGFSGSPSANGKMTVRGYEWELNYLRNFYVPQDISVFITETGWVNNGFSQEKIASYYKQAFSEVWSDPRIVAVTPFLLRYDAAPFKGFSWKIPGTNTFYPYFKEVLGISKVAGSPD